MSPFFMPKKSLVSKQKYIVAGTFRNLFFGPDAGLDLSDVGFLQQIHAQTRLSDAATDGKGHIAVQEGFVEIKIQTVGATAYFQLFA